MSVKLTEQVPAFRIDDRVLERLWRGVEAKWAGEQPDVNTFTVRERVRVAGRRAREEHQHDYQSVEELRRTPGGPDVLRNYTLAVSSWGKESRQLRFGAYGDGYAATVEVNAADAAWCREVADTVLELLRPHTLWYAAVHRISLWVAFAAMIATLGGLPLAIFYGSPQWNILLVALYLLFLVLIAFRDLIFPAADILVRRRGTQSAAPGGRSWDPLEMPGSEPARLGRGDVLGPSGRRERKRSEGGGTTFELNAWPRTSARGGDHGLLAEPRATEEIADPSGIVGSIASPVVRTIRHVAVRDLQEEQLSASRTAEGAGGVSARIDPRGPASAEPEALRTGRRRRRPTPAHGALRTAGRRAVGSGPAPCGAGARSET